MTVWQVRRTGQLADSSRLNAIFITTMLTITHISFDWKKCDNNLLRKINTKQTESRTLAPMYVAGISHFFSTGGTNTPAASFPLDSYRTHSTTFFKFLLQISKHRVPCTTNKMGHRQISKVWQWLRVHYKQIHKHHQTLTLTIIQLRNSQHVNVWWADIWT